MVIRLLDILFSGLALILLLPLFIPVALILKFTGEGEIFFSQKRVGKGGNLFNLLKFATMLKDSPSIGTGTVTLKDDPRVLPIGKFLRKTKINEIPQLINILVGDMSVVGPRPQTPRCFKVFPKDLQPIISSIRPGLSGLGPVVFRDEESILSENSKSVDFYDQVIAPYKGAIECYYVSNRNCKNYFKIIVVTIWVVLFPRSKIVWKVFSELPKPPHALSGAILNL